MILSLGNNSTSLISVSGFCPPSFTHVHHPSHMAHATITVLIAPSSVGPRPRGEACSTPLFAERLRGALLSSCHSALLSHPQLWTFQISTESIKKCVKIRSFVVECRRIHIVVCTSSGAARDAISYELYFACLVVWGAHNAQLENSFLDYFDNPVFVYHIRNVSQGYTREKTTFDPF